MLIREAVLVWGKGVYGESPYLLLNFSVALKTKVYFENIIQGSRDLCVRGRKYFRRSIHGLHISPLPLPPSQCRHAPPTASKPTPAVNIWPTSVSFI